MNPSNGDLPVAGEEIDPFPPGTPNFTHGELAVTYNLRSDGSVDGMDFSPALVT